MKPLAILRPVALAPLILLCSTHPVATDARLLPFEPVDDVLPARVTMPIDHVFTSAREYRLLFGHDAPGVDWSHEWVALYSAGLMEGGHHIASILQIRRVDDGGSLDVVTLLQSDLCQVVREPERPMALAKFPIPADELGLVQFVHVYMMVACGP